MAASFPPMMFSMEELVGVVKLIIQMESAVGNNDQNNNNNNNIDQKQNQNQNPNQKYQNGHGARKHKNGHKSKYSKYKHKKNGKKKKSAPNIQKWISRRNKSDILFLLASISGVKMKIYSLPTSSIYLNKKLFANNSVANKKPLKKNKQSIIRDRICRISMDGKYLSMGEDCINLNSRLEISLGIDLCYSNVRLILKQLGLYQYFVNNTYGDNTSSGSSSSSSSSTSSSSKSKSVNKNTTTMDEILKNARFNHKLSSSDKLKPKHCITIHNPITSRTLILQLSNCSDRTMWAKGICHLKNCNQKARNFRWTVVAYLISKYASTLNAHTTNNMSVSRGLRGGVTKGFNVLKMGLNLNGSNKVKSNTKQNTSYPSMTTGACYFEPFRQIMKAIHSNNNNYDRKYPKKFQKLYKRRQRRLKYKQSNYASFGENDLIYDPNKAQLKPEDMEKYYE